MADKLQITAGVYAKIEKRGDLQDLFSQCSNAGLVGIDPKKGLTVTVIQFRKCGTVFLPEQFHQFAICIC